MTLNEFKKKYQPAVSDAADELYDKLNSAKKYPYSEKNLRGKSVREWEKDCIEHLFERLIKFGNTNINSTVWDKMLLIDSKPEKDIVKVVKYMTKANKVTVNIKEGVLHTTCVIGCKKSKALKLVCIEVNT